MLALLAAAAALGPCAADTPASLQLTGIPPVATSGKAYAATLSGEGPVVETAGSDIAVHDAAGEGWNAHFQNARGAEQPFSVGLSPAPVTVTASWTEPGPCTRTVSVTLPVERRILGVVNCRRGALAPATGLILRCDGTKLRLRSLTWSGWNQNTTIGRGTLDGRPATVTLSRPQECSELDGFIYTRARVSTARGRVFKRIVIDCPLPPPR